MAALYGAGVRGGRAHARSRRGRRSCSSSRCARVGARCAARHGGCRSGSSCGRHARARVRRCSSASTPCCRRAARRLRRPRGGRARAEARPVPVAAYFLGRCLLVRREELVRLAGPCVGAAAVVAALGLLDDYFVPISWWRDSAVVDYFHKHLGYDYNGTGGLPENFIYNTGSEDHFLPPARLRLPRTARERVHVRRRAAARGARSAAGARLVIAIWRARDPRRAALHVLALVAARARRRPRRPRCSSAPLVAGRRCRRDARRRDRVGARVPARRADGELDAAGPRPAAQATRSRIQARAEAPASTTSRRSTATGSACARVCAPSIHHPQGFGLGNAGQTASRTETPIKAGRVELHGDRRRDGAPRRARSGSAWGLAILVGARLAARDALVGGCGRRGRVRRRARPRRPDGRDRRPVDGLRPLGSRRDLSLAPVALHGDGDRPASGHRARPPEGEPTSSARSRSTVTSSASR